MYSKNFIYSHNISLLQSSLDNSNTYANCPDRATETTSETIELLRVRFIKSLIESVFKISKILVNFKQFSSLFISKANFQ